METMKRKQDWIYRPRRYQSSPALDRSHLRRFAPGVKTSCLFHFDEPVSPHLAVERAATSSSPPTFPTDHEFAAAVAKFTDGFAQDVAGHRSSLYIESAGGALLAYSCNDSPTDPAHQASTPPPSRAPLSSTPSALSFRRPFSSLPTS